jgi:hypothetical protein
MKFRYALVLPVLHLAIALPPLFHQELGVWRYIPEAQAIEDFEKAHPPSQSNGVQWDPCYEYRMSSDSRLIFAADLPVAVLIGTSAYGCSLGAVRLVPIRLNLYMRVKSSVILIEALIVLGVFTQWWLIGSWLDRRYNQSKAMRRWIIPIAVITVGGIVMASTAFGQRGVTEYVNIYSAMVTLLAWIVLMVMLIVAGTAWVIRRIRQAPQPTTSRP